MNATDNSTFGGRDVLLRDHTATSDVYSKLVEVRFKLLTFVPTVTTIAVGLVTLDKTRAGSTDSPSLFGAANLLVIGLIGLVATLALVIYEVRNSQIHDRAIHRIKHLEVVLGFRPSYRGDFPRGVFGERGRGAALSGVVGVKHDRALAMIYGIVTAAWTALVLFGAAEVIDLPGTGWPCWIWFSAMLAGLGIASEIGRLSGRDREPPLIYMLDPVFRAAKPGPNINGVSFEGAQAVLDKLDQAHKFVLPASRSLRANVVARLKNERSTEQDRPPLPERVRPWLGDWLARRGFRTNFDLAEHLERDTEHPNGKPPRGNSVLDLAYAVGVIKDRQSMLFWLWYRPWLSGKEERAKRLIAQPGQKTTVSALRDGIVGADDVHAVLAENEWLTPAPDGVVVRLIEQESVKRINRRYGDGAPWASSQEVNLRIYLLLAAHYPPVTAAQAEPVEEHRVRSALMRRHIRTWRGHAGDLLNARRRKG